MKLNFYETLCLFILAVNFLMFIKSRLNRELDENGNVTLETKLDELSSLCLVLFGLIGTLFTFIHNETLDAILTVAQVVLGIAGTCLFGYVMKLNRDKVRKNRPSRLSENKS